MDCKIKNSLTQLFNLLTNLFSLISFSMGGEPSNRQNRGIFWLATNRRSPFGQGILI